MCGRFSFSVNERIIEEHYGFVPNNHLSSNYNCAPLQTLAVITNQNPHEFSFFLWGFIPSWTKDFRVASKMINARSETLSEKPAFRSAFKNKRCLVPADSFYEWGKDSEKIPYRIFLKSQKIFSMAGIWNVWKKQENEIYSFAIITTKANSKMKTIHDRMPVILENKEKETTWLFENDVQKLTSLFSPIESEHLEIYPISKQVNSVKNNSELLHKKHHYEGLF